MVPDIKQPTLFKPTDLVKGAELFATPTGVTFKEQHYVGYRANDSVVVWVEPHVMCFTVCVRGDFGTGDLIYSEEAGSQSLGTALEDAWRAAVALCAVKDAELFNEVCQSVLRVRRVKSMLFTLQRVAK